MFTKKGNIIVPKNFGSWIKMKRVELGLSQKQLGLEATLGERTIKNIESGRKHEFRNTTLKVLADALTIDFEELLYFIDNNYFENLKLKPDKWTFNNIFKLCNTTDEYLIELIRSERPSINRKFFYRSYEDSLISQLKAFGINLEQFLSLHKDSKRLNILLNSIPPPKVTINIENDFKRITFGFNNSELKIENPQLLWPCSCKTTPPQKCTIHSSELGDHLGNLMGNEIVEIKWQEYSFLWKNCKGLWPPSVDSFYFLDVLFSNTVAKKKYNSILDVGCGSGFLGLISANNFNSKEVYLSDWTCTSYLFSVINYYRNNMFKKITFNYLIGIDFNWINHYKKRIFDLLICNPPYLPIPEEFSELLTMHTVAGTDLLLKVISESKNYSNNAYVQFSNLAKQIVIDSINSSGGKINYDNLSKFSIPFRIPEALQQKEYIAWLIKQGLQVRQNSPFLYFHDLSMLHIK